MFTFSIDTGRCAIRIWYAFSPICYLLHHWHPAHSPAFCYGRFACRFIDLANGKGKNNFKALCTQVHNLHVWREWGCWYARPEAAPFWIRENVWQANRQRVDRFQPRGTCSTRLNNIMDFWCGSLMRRKVEYFFKSKTILYILRIKFPIQKEKDCGRIGKKVKIWQSSSFSGLWAIGKLSWADHLHHWCIRGHINGSRLRACLPDVRPHCTLPCDLPADNKGPQEAADCSLRTGKQYLCYFSQLVSTSLTSVKNSRGADINPVKEITVKPRFPSFSPTFHCISRRQFLPCSCLFPTFSRSTSHSFAWTWRLSTTSAVLSLRAFPPGMRRWWFFSCPHIDGDSWDCSVRSQWMHNQRRCRWLLWPCFEY